jgi:uncharacterized protein (DUF2235 family)
MAKRIASCSDGTWDGIGNNTNVYKLYKAIVSVPGEQVAYYDDGVGTDGTPLEHLLGGAFGLGLFQKIKDAYAKIALVYEPGDEIFLFGFSRGAYTARCLAGMIANCGLPTKNPNAFQVDTAFQAYRDKAQRAALLATLAPFDMRDARLTMVGVWDTVGSLGIPALVGGVDPLLYGFLDTNLHPDVMNAYQALAIDEKRAEFPAAVWTSPPAAGQTIEQVYFCGVHCDVGGGYADDPSTQTALSNIPLTWMMSKARALGLVLAPEIIAKYPSPIGLKYALDTRHESWSRVWLFPKFRTIPANATLANSVAVRCQEDSAYRPANLTLVNGAPGPQYGHAVVAG